jgi:hypothetical protein
LWDYFMIRIMKVLFESFNMATKCAKPIR